MADDLMDYINRQNNPTADDVVNYAPAVPVAAIPVSPASAGASATSAQLGVPPTVPPAPTRPEDGFQSVGGVMEYNNALRSHEQAMRDAEQYAKTAKYLHDVQHVAEVQTAAGDFHKAFADIPHTDPDFSSKTASLLGEHAAAASDPSVLHSVALKLNANKQFIAAQGVAQKQAQKDTDTAHKVISAGIASGTLFSTDFPQWDGKPATRPDWITPDNKINTQYLSNLSATRQAAGMGVKGETAERTTARKDIATWDKELANPDIDDATRTQIAAARQVAVQKLLSTTPGAGASGATGPAAAPKKDLSSYIP